MRITHIWTDDAGISHFGELEVELAMSEYAPPAPAFGVSSPTAAESLRFFELPAGWFGDWHPSPLRQLYLNLSGQLEVEVGDGEVRLVGSGDAILLEDLTGTGHVTRVVGDEPSSGVFVQLAPARTD